MNFKEFKDKYQKVPVNHFPYQFKNNPFPLLSICVVTYQHRNYISDCLDGILMQDVDFDYEILLGEDQSEDGTREICIQYAQKYPDKIRLFLHNRNNNIFLNNSPSGRFNMLYNIFSARGKFLAFCEGDDIWIDNKKLQKQIDFLRNNRNHSLTSHEAYKWRLNDSNSIRRTVSVFYRNFILIGFKQVCRIFWECTVHKKKLERFTIALADAKRIQDGTIEDFVKNKLFIPLHTIVTRREIFNVLPDEFGSFSGLHLPIILWAVLHGKNYHFKEIMGVKRDQETSMTLNKKRKSELKKLSAQDREQIYLFFMAKVPLYQKEAFIKPLLNIYNQKLRRALELDDFYYIDFYNKKIQRLKDSNFTKI